MSDLRPGATWRLHCPDCDQRRFHDPVDGDDRTVECRSCGSTAPLETRKATSRNVEPNPDRDQPTLQQWEDAAQAGDRR